MNEHHGCSWLARPNLIESPFFLVFLYTDYRMPETEKFCREEVILGRMNWIAYPKPTDLYRESISSEVTNCICLNHDRSIGIWTNPARGGTQGIALIIVWILIGRSRSKQKNLLPWVIRISCYMAISETEIFLVTTSNFQIFVLYHHFLKKLELATWSAHYLQILKVWGGN